MIELLLAAENALALGLLDQAEHTYRQVLESDPRNGIAAVGLARVALERGDEAGAIRLARGALDIDPENATARRMIDRLEEVARFRGEVATPGGEVAGPGGDVAGCEGDAERREVAEPVGDVVRPEGCAERGDLVGLADGTGPVGATSSDGVSRASSAPTQHRGDPPSGSDAPSTASALGPDAAGNPQAAKVSGIATPHAPPADLTPETLRRPEQLSGAPPLPAAPPPAAPLPGDAPPPPAQQPHPAPARSSLLRRLLRRP